jgi:hypothetical protein
VPVPGGQLTVCDMPATFRSNYARLWVLLLALTEENVQLVMPAPGDQASIVTTCAPRGDEVPSHAGADDARPDHGNAQVAPDPLSLLRPLRVGVPAEESLKDGRGGVDRR